MSWKMSLVFGKFCHLMLKVLEGLEKFKSRVKLLQNKNKCKPEIQ